MSIYKTRKEYFSALAVADPNIKHTAAYTDTDGVAHVRNSFIELSAEQDALSADMINGLSYPFVVQAGFTGGLTDRDDDIRNRFYNKLQFLTKIITTDEQPSKQAAIDDAKDLTYQIMKAWLNKMRNDVAYDSCNTTFKKIDFNTVSWQDLGPVSDQFYGWELSFTDDMPAHDVIDYNVAYWA